MSTTCALDVYNTPFQVQVATTKPRNTTKLNPLIHTSIEITGYALPPSQTRANKKLTPVKAPPHRMLTLRTLARSSLPTTRRASILAHRITRTMASTSASLQEWLVIIPDHQGALDKRIAARPKHLEGLKSDRDDMWLWGGMSQLIPTIRISDAMGRS